MREREGKEQLTMYRDAYLVAFPELVILIHEKKVSSEKQSLVFHLV